MRDPHGLRVTFKRIAEVQDVTIYRLIRAWAQDTPEAVALVSPDHEPITYRQLLLQTDAMIKSLR
jgi:acyl-CoA synthetase (AMP-forming)/AMP-acid ligase II